MGSYTEQASRAPLPGAGAQITVPAASSSAAVDLSAYLNRWVLLIADVKTHYRAGDASVGAAVATDVWMAADQERQHFVVPGRTHLRVFGASSAGLLSYAEVG